MGKGQYGRSALADAGFQWLYLACDQAFDWSPADPRLESLLTPWSLLPLPAYPLRSA
jgi:hypothetical protein